MVGAGVPDADSLIAIVDDDASMLAAINALMRSLGFASQAFSSGKDFLDSPHLQRTACLIADVNMPGMTGLELHRHLVTAGRRIPTILITAYPNDHVRARALAAGVIGYLSKPFAEDELLGRIRSALTRGN
jgi:FixJ family two-component response regulator